MVFLQYLNLEGFYYYLHENTTTYLTNDVFTVLTTRYYHCNLLIITNTNLISYHE